MKNIFKLLLMSSLFLVGCKQEGFQSKIIFNFINACVSSGSSIDHCSCVMDSIQKQMPQKEYAEEEIKFSTQGKASDKLAGVLAKSSSECSK